MRIAIATEFFHPHVGGTEFRLREMSKRLVKRGHTVHVFTVRYDSNLPKDEESEGIHIHRYATNAGYETANGMRSVSGVLSYAISTMIRVAATDFDVWYFGQWPMLHSLLSKIFVSSLVQEWCEVWYRKIVPFEKATARATMHHVAVSESIKRRMVEFLGIRAEDIAVIYSGIDSALFNAKSSEKRWGRIVYIGRIASHKRLDILLNAYQLAKVETPEIELHLAGSGPALSTISKEASKLEGVHVYGYISEPAKVELLRSSWLFAMPSEREGLPHAPLEAMAAGTPVLTVNDADNGTVEICKEGNGIITSHQPQAIAAAITRALREEEEWKQMSTRARCFAKRFDWDRCVDDLEGYLTAAVEKMT